MLLGKVCSPEFSYDGIVCYRVLTAALIEADVQELGQDHQEAHDGYQDVVIWLGAVFQKGTMLQGNEEDIIALATFTSAPITTTTQTPTTCWSLSEHLYSVEFLVMPYTSTESFALTITRFLLVLYILPYICNSLIISSDDPFGSYVQNKQQASERGILSRPSGRYYLLNECSKRLFQVLGRNLRARGKPGDNFAVLQVEASIEGGTVQIRSDVTGDSVCFNRQGGLVVRHIGGGSRCRFYWTHTNTDKVEFISVSNTSWKIGFRKNGLPLPARGLQKDSRRTCSHFTSIPLATDIIDSSKSTWNFGNVEHLFSNPSSPQPTGSPARRTSRQRSDSTDGSQKNPRNSRRQKHKLRHARMRPHVRSVQEV